MKNKILALAFSFIAIISILLVFSNYRIPSKVTSSQPKISSKPEIFSESPQNPPYYRDIVLKKLRLTGDDSIYSLKDGEAFRDGVKLQPESDKEKIERVLRLALFYQWTKEDPLFASPDLDLNKFEGSIKRLKKEQNDFLAKYGWRDPVFPINFLEKFAESSRVQDSFLSDASEKNALLLVEAIKRVNEEYRSEAENLGNAIEGTGDFGPSGKRVYAALGGSTFSDTDIILGDLEKIKANSGSIDEEIEKREYCLLNSWKSCQRPMEKFAEPELPEADQELPLVLLTKKELGFKENTDYFGPYEINSSCWQGKDKNYLYVSKECDSDPKYCTEASYLATDTYFSLVGSFSPLEIYLKEKGVGIKPQSATTPYTCIDLEYQPKLATLNYFYGKFKSKRFYQGIKNKAGYKNFPEDFKKIIDRGEDAENSFFGSGYPGEDSLKYLSDFYGFTYNYLSMNNSGSADEKADLLKRHLLLKGKMADFDLVMNRISSFFSGFNHKPVITTLPKFYIYPIRSDYSVFFFNFSPFVWKNSDKPQYLIKDAAIYGKGYSMDDMGTMDYQTAISKYGKENFERWAELYARFKDEKF